MCRIVLMFIFAVALFQARPAFADVNLCNSTDRPIWAAYGEEYFSDGSPYNLSGWAAGWYYTLPGQCTTPLTGDVCFWWADVWGNCPVFIVVYGNDAFGDQWGGTGNTAEPICTTYNAFFEDPEIDLNDMPCALGRVLLNWYGAPDGGDSVNVNFTQ